MSDLWATPVKCIVHGHVFFADKYCRRCGQPWTGKLGSLYQATDEFRTAFVVRRPSVYETDINYRRDMQAAGRGRLLP